MSFTAEADADLRGIWLFSADRWGEEKADAYLAKIGLRLEYVRDRPERGRSLEGLPPFLRFVKSGRHFAFYRWDERMLRVVRVLHESMDPGRYLPD